jgi:hypothetical protein
VVAVVKERVKCSHVSYLAFDMRLLAAVRDHAVGYLGLCRGVGLDPNTTTNSSLKCIHFSQSIHRSTMEE